jgi:hypothetical protein
LYAKLRRGKAGCPLLISALTSLFPLPQFTSVPMLWIGSASELWISIFRLRAAEWNTKLLKPVVKGYKIHVIIDNLKEGYVFRDGHCLLDCCLVHESSSISDR